MAPPCYLPGTFQVCHQLDQAFWRFRLAVSFLSSQPIRQFSHHKLFHFALFSAAQHSFPVPWPTLFQGSSGTTIQIHASWMQLTVSNWSFLLCPACTLPIVKAVCSFWGTLASNRGFVCPSVFPACSRQGLAWRTENQLLDVTPECSNKDISELMQLVFL